MLNRLGQSIPPILVADWVRRVSYKKFVLLVCALAMGACFLVLAAVWNAVGSEHPAWLPYFFLLVYGVFWFCVGIHNLCLSLLYGKLVAVNSRGLLMLVAITIGSVTAIGSAWVWMGPWLTEGSPAMVRLFVFSGTSFVLAAGLAVFLYEPAERAAANPQSSLESFRQAGKIVWQDANFRLLAMIAGCFGMAVTLMPHYQAYVKQVFEIRLAEFVPWVIAQNLGAASFSVPLGRLADRWGNRLALQVVMLLLCAAPLLTVVLVHIGQPYARTGFYAVFFLLGLLPLSMRVFNNYTLEIAGSEEQPIYLSTLGICIALPVLLVSVLVGWLMDIVGFQFVFLLILMILLLGWTLTFKLIEPRSSEAGESKLH